MKKQLSVAKKLSKIEHHVPHRPFEEMLNEAVNLAASLDPAEFDDTDRIVAKRIVRDLAEVLAELPNERRRLGTLYAHMQALVPDYMPEPPEPVTDHCRHCDEPFQPRRSDARYCSTRCRVAAKRLRDRAELAVTDGDRP